MPSFNNIDNGESGLSVRNTLNDVINYVNTGITQDDKYVTGGTYNNSTGTLTLNRQNGSVNVTGFLTGVTETQNLTNVLAIGNTTGANNIVVNNGQSVQSVSGNTKMEFVSDTQLDITSTGDIYISGGTSVEIEYYGSPTITGYVLLDNTQSKLHFDNGSTTSELELNSGGFSSFNISQGTTYANVDLQVTDVTLQVGDGTNTATETISAQELTLGVNDGTTYSTVELDPFGNANGNRLLSTNGTDTSTIGFTPDTITSLVDKSYELFSGTTNAYPSVLQEVKGTLVFNLVGITATTYFNSSDNIIVYFTGDSKYYYSVDLSSVGIITSPNGTQLVVNGSGGMSNTYVGQGCYVFNPTKGGNGSEVIPSSVYTDTTEIQISDSRILHQIVDGVSSTTLDLDLANGTNLNVNNGTTDINLVLDGGTGLGIFSSEVGDITDTLIISPDSNVNNTKLRSEDTNTGVYSEIVMTYDNPSFNISDGGTNSGGITLAVSNTVINHSDGTTTSGLELDPSVSSNGTRFYNINSSISSSTGILLEPDQSYQWAGDYNYGMTAYSENFLSSTNQYLFQQHGDYVSQLTLDPASLNSGTFFKFEDLVTGVKTTLELDPLGNFNGNRFYSEDGVSSSANINVNPTGSAGVVGTDGTTTSEISISPSIAIFGTNDTPNSIYHKFQVEVGVGYIVSSNNPTITNETKLYGDTTSSTWTAISGGSINAITLTHNNINISNLPSFDDDAAASGLTTGDLYQTTGGGASPLNVAGILMVKQ